MPEKRAKADARVAAIAARQHGVASIEQLRAAGLSDQAVSERRRAGRLHRMHRGVYAVGHTAPSAERRWMAAVLALRTGAPGGGREAADTAEAAGRAPTGARSPAGPAGAQAVLSHRSAAALWRMLPPGDGPVDVSVPSGGGRRSRSGIRIHRSASLDATQVTSRRGIPVTTPARTVADLRAVLAPEELRRAARQADVLGLPLGPEAPVDGTRSELEGAFLRLCRRHRLPQPRVNMRIGQLLVDFCWPERQLVVETDGYRYHRGRAAFEDDRSRDLRLQARGYRVLRLTHRQVTGEPAEVAAVLHGALAQSP